MNKEETITITKKEYDVLVKAAFLISDAVMAEKNDGFKEEMNVNPCENRKKADDLIYQWECMG